MNVLVAHFRAMARNNAWSNHRLHQACAQLSAADYTAKRTSFFPTIQWTLDHILVVDRLYLDALEGRPKSIEAYDDDLRLDFADLRAAQGVEDRRLMAFCDALTTEGLSDEATLLRQDGPKRDTVSAILPHLFVHQIHHRGQVHAMLAGTAVAPPQLDEFFLTEDIERRREDFAALGWPLEPRA